MKHTPVGFTIGFSQLLFTSSEGDGSVPVCTELKSGEINVTLGTVSLSVMANLGNSTGIYYIIACTVSCVLLT